MPAPAPPVVTPSARPAEPTPAAPVPEPVALVPVEPTFPAPVAPVPSTAFVRRNGTPLTREVTR
ncbi:hypothetical protein DLE60_19010 [Micromonospora globispora]|uniref:Uncharacterized protein n=1 Tax=Micromonospora globispora TaxID=1450148 RepID=A0A317JU28_9ACTN|nr:hypothetical protein DLJ46_26735 [Micromonospora globispora]PWU58949.1 hypothetical protein DLE60_19010 [Micromonospora globispora]RQX00348.1 hypothetical protein DKL51_06910 [Micromonospora globispora]